MIYSTVIGRSDMPFQLFLGGRGIGKTFSALEDVANNTEECTLWCRRYGDEMADVCEGGLFTALQAKGKALNMRAEMKKTAAIGYIYRDDEKVGYVTGISCFAKKRGVDYPDITRIIVDEISPEEHRPYFKGEGKALLNMYESINRNRELDGKNPVKLIMMSNCVKLDTPIFLTIPNLLKKIQTMISTGERRHTDRDMGLYIEIMENIELSEKKSKTALYKLLGTKSEITRSNVENSFVKDDLTVVRKRKNVNIQEYDPVMMYGDISIYEHKSNGAYYVSREESSAKLKFVESQKDLFRKTFAIEFRCAIARREIFFSDYDLYILIAQLMGYKYY